MKWLLAFLIIFPQPTYARDPDGRYANSPLHNWFMSLHDDKGVACCDVADGKRLDEVDWDIKDEHYRVRLEDRWIDVPDSAVIKVPNLAQVAMVWPTFYNGKVDKIRCFMPGALL